MSLLSVFDVSVIERNNIITVMGVRHCVDLLNRVELIYNTSKVTSYLFLTGTSHSFSFHSFHVLEVITMFEQLLEISGAKAGRTPVKTIRNIIAKLTSDTWVKYVERDYPSLLDKSRLKEFTITPLKHQMEFCDHYDQITQKYALTGLMTAASPGTGKTMMSLFLQRMLPIDVVVIVCPLPTLLDVWVKSLRIFYKKEPLVWHSKSAEPIPDYVEYIVIHYEYLGKFLDTYSVNEKLRYGVVLDESHNFNESSGRTDRFIHMCAVLASKHVVWLSGTPIKAIATEAIPLIRTIDPLFTPQVEARFRKAFAGSNSQMNGLLGTRLEIYMKKVHKDVLDLPPPIEVVLAIKMKNGADFTLPVIVDKIKQFIIKRGDYYRSRAAADKKVFFTCLSAHELTLRTPASKNAYQVYRTNLDTVVAANGGIMAIGDIVRSVSAYENNVLIPSIAVDLRRQFRDIRANYKYAKLKIVGEALGQVLTTERIRCFSELAKQVDYLKLIEETSTKTLIFASNIEVVDTAFDRCKSLGLNPIAVHANATNVPTAVKQMENDPTADPLIATYSSLSTGVPLTMCSAIVLLNMPFRGTTLIQAIARAHRHGQTEQVYVYKVILDTGEVANLSTRTEEIMVQANKSVLEITGIDYTQTVSGVESLTDVTVESFSYLLDGVTDDSICSM